MGAYFVPEPGEEVWRGGEEAAGVHGVPDDLGDGPGKQKEGEAEGGLRGWQEVEDEPCDVDPVTGLVW